MSTKDNWLAGALGFVLGRATAPAPGPAAAVHRPSLPPPQMPVSEEERWTREWRVFDPLHDKVFLVPIPIAGEFPRIFPRLGRQRMDGCRADYLYWLGTGKYGFVQPSTCHTHRNGPGWVLVRDEPGWGWDVSAPTLDLEQLRQGVLADSAAPPKLAITFNWGVLPAQHLPAGNLYEPGTNWAVAGEPTVPIPYAWASELGFTELNPFKSGTATAPAEPAEPILPYSPPSAGPARGAPRPAPGPYPPPLPPPTEEEVWRRGGEWYPFEPDKATPWRTSTRLPVYPRLGRRRPDGYRADYLYWLGADAFCFPQPDGYEERRVGPGWILLREEPGWGWEVSEPTTDLVALEQWLWAKSAAPRHIMATWKWGVLPECALPEHRLGGDGTRWHPDDDPVPLLPTDWAESLRFIAH